VANLLVRATNPIRLRPRNPLHNPLPNQHHQRRIAHQRRNVGPSGLLLPLALHLLPNRRPNRLRHRLRDVLRAPAPADSLPSPNSLPNHQRRLPSPRTLLEEPDRIERIRQNRVLLGRDSAGYIPMGFLQTARTKRPDLCRARHSLRHQGPRASLRRRRLTLMRLGCPRRRRALYERRRRNPNSEIGKE
jgi:hypothetical protein